MRDFGVLVLAFFMSACQISNTDLNYSVPDPNTIQVMVIGTYHFVASESDVVSLETKSVLNPQSQLELDAIASAIASFNPTHVVVERETDSPGYIDHIYEQYGPEMLAETTNERVQLAYRIANRSDLSVVHGLDEQSRGSEPDYFPFGKLQNHAILSGQGNEFDKMVSGFRAKAEEEIAKSEDEAIASRLISTNTGFLASPIFYYQLSQFDRGETQPAAELQAYWFMRNAKIFSKLRNVTEPGNRVVIVYGAGHKFWLEHFVENTPGFSSIDPIPYLELAK